MNQKLLIVQPHSDDALFSCSNFLFNPEYQVEILTIENNSKRIEEDKKLYKFLNIPFYHLNSDFDDQSYYSYHKKYKEVTVEQSYTHLQDFFDKETLLDIESQLSEFLAAYFKRNKKVIVVAPWGIGHPFHIFIRDILEKNISLLWYYREFPHSYKKRSRIQVEHQLEDFELKYNFPTEETADVKWGLAKKFYKTQSSLLFFEGGHISKNYPEEIYIRKEQDLPF